MPKCSVFTINDMIRLTMFQITVSKRKSNPFGDKLIQTQSISRKISARLLINVQLHSTAIEQRDKIKNSLAVKATQKRTSWSV